jgi:hypothetical protein
LGGLTYPDLEQLQGFWLKMRKKRRRKRRKEWKEGKRKVN